MKGLGIRQRKMIVEMLVRGNGSWPTGWRMTSTDREIMASLYRAGMVDAPGWDAKLTGSGRTAAGVLRGDRMVSR